MNRRDLLKTGVASAAAFVPYTFTSHAEAQATPRSANERWNVGAIGMRYA